MAGYLIGGRLVAGGGLDAGEITVRAILPASASIELPLNDGGSIDASVTLPLVDPITQSQVNLAEMLVPGRDFIGWVEDDVIIEAGPIWGDPYAFPYSDRLVANGMWSYFDHRYVLPAFMEFGTLPRDVETRHVGLSLGTIAKRLVQTAIADPAARLPIDFQPDVLGDHERTYPGSDLKTVGDALRDLTAVEGGPDITFRPKWGASRKHVRWDMLTTPTETSLAGDHYWDTSVDDPHARILNLDRDGSVLTSREFGIGTTLQNLFSTDPSFESGTDAVELGSFSASIVWQPYGAHGNRHFSWSATGTSGFSAINVKQNISIEPGEPLTFSFWGHHSMPSSHNMAGMIRFYNEGGDQIGGDIVGPVTAVARAEAYTRVNVTAVAPEGTHSAKCYMFGYPTGAGQGFGADAIMALKTTEIHPFVVDSIELQHVARNNALLDAGFPLMESTTRRDSVKLVDTVRAYANEAVARGSAHVETFEIVARRDKIPTLGTYWPGDYAKVRIGPNARIPADTYRVRIVSLSFAKNGDVTIQCAPERIASGYPVPSSDRNWFRDQLRTLSKRIAETTRGA